VGSDSPYVTDTGGSQASSADSGTVQTADRSDASPTDTPPAAPDGGAGGGEAFDNPGADTGQQETTSEAGPDTPQQAAPAPDGGAGGGEAFDNPDSEATSPPPDTEQQDQRQEVTTDDQQPTDDQRAEEFQIDDWTGYPDGPRPEGPFRILEGDEYKTARDAANRANRAIHRADPSLADKQIHEVHPVKFNGDPVDPSNKVPVSPQEHAAYTTWWNRQLRERKAAEGEE
jgi:hypothetical protein